MSKTGKFTTLPSGSVLPLNGFGTWKAEPGRCADALRLALDLGYRHIDLAAVYANEPELGAVFEEYCSGPSPKVPRDHLFITSKVWNTCHAREHVMDAVKQTLSDLRLTYLDLYLVHHPFAFDFAGLPVTDDNWVARDPSDPYNIKWAPKGVTLETTWRGMEDVYEAKLARNIGVSNYNAALLVDLRRYANIQPAVHQFEGHPMFQRTELIELGRRLGIHTTLYSILGSGKQGPLQNPVIADIAAKHHCSPAAVCIAWGLRHGCSILAKSTKPEHIRNNFEAEKLVLDEVDLAKIQQLDSNLRTCNMVEYWDFPSHV